MMNNKKFYWDTSALLSLVFAERDSKSTIDFVQREKAIPGFTSFFTLVEMESALRRRISESLVLTELSQVRFKIKQLESGISLVWATTEIVEGCRKAVSDYGLRPGDALQLASCLTLFKDSPLIFVCRDTQLNLAAKACGVPCAF